MHDYADAAERHYLSADALLAGHPATASHCYGLAAECVLKALMSNLQPQVQRVSGNHIGPKLWAEFSHHQMLQRHPSRVFSATRHQHGLRNWDIGQRYLARVNPQFGAHLVADERLSARGLLGLLQLIQRGLA
jgi:hypothetical protein